MVARPFQIQDSRLQIDTAADRLTSVPASPRMQPVSEFQDDNHRKGVSHVLPGLW